MSKGLYDAGKKAGNGQYWTDNLVCTTMGRNQFMYWRENHEVCDTLNEAWELRWILNKTGNVIENHFMPLYRKNYCLWGWKCGETPAQVLVNIALGYGMFTVNQKILEIVLKTLRWLATMYLNKVWPYWKLSYQIIRFGLSTDKFIYFIESKVEDDLNWIRINGAIVGAVVCLLMDLPRICMYYMPFGNNL